MVRSAGRVVMDFTTRRTRESKTSPLLNGDHLSVEYCVRCVMTITALTGAAPHSGRECGTVRGLTARCWLGDEQRSAASDISPIEIEIAPAKAIWARAAELTRNFR